MRSIKLVLFCAIAGLSSLAGASDVHVRGYTKSNGTYVQPHVRSAPDNNLYNNYSTKGNTNPYNGKQGTIEPYKSGYQNNYNSNSDDSD